MIHKKVVIFLGVLACYSVFLEIQFACGGLYSPETVFTFAGYASPETTPAEFAQGRLGILSERALASRLLVAYRHLTGVGLTSQEQTAMLDYWERGWDAVWLDIRTAGSRWIEARAAVNAGNTPDPDLLASYLTINYASFYNCLPAAFDNASRTLEDRVRQFGSKSAEVSEWLAGQDQVFQNCRGQAEIIPKPAPDDLAPLIRDDRQYQIAAAYFYSGDYEEAAQRFSRIAADPDSPWRTYGLYLAGRSKLRRGTIADDWDSLMAASELFRVVLDDPDLEALHPSAAGLLRLIAVRTGSAEIANEVAALSSSLGSERLPEDVTVPMNDYVQLIDRPWMERLEETDDAMSLWIRRFRSEPKAEEAFEWYRTDPNLPNLLLALRVAASENPAAANLLESASAVEPGSPGYLTAAYHDARLRLGGGDDDGARRTIDRVLETSGDELSISTRNRFLALRMPLAKSLDAFLKDAVRVPLFQGSAGWGDEFVEWELKNRRWEESPLSAALDFDAAETMNTWFSTEKFVEASESDDLDEGIRRSLRFTAWSRALVLEQWASADALADRIILDAPEAEPAVRDYLSAVTPEDKRFAASLAILRLPGTTVYVRPGDSNNRKLDVIDAMEMNWWSMGSASSGLFFSTPVVYREPLFLSDTELDVVAEERERLRRAKPVYEYAWPIVEQRVEARPDDPRVPEALHRIVWATQECCRNYPKGRISKLAFDLLHERYPTSEWAKKTPHWFE